jgi:predicted PurR-regulated permease PerM
MALVVIPSMFLLLILSEQIYDLYGKIHFTVNYETLKNMGNHKLVDGILSFFNIEKADVGERVLSYFKATSMSAFSSITSIVSFPINFIIKFFLMMLILFFLFKDAYNVEAAVYRILPLPTDLEMNIVTKLKGVIYVLMLGNLFIMLLQGLMVGVGLYIAGLNTPLIWGTLAAMLSLIPVIGTTLIWLPASIYLYYSGNYAMAVFAAVWCFSWYMLLENLVKPKIFGDKLNFHPLLFFFLLLGSIEAFNLPGVIIGPIILSLFYSFWEIYKILDDYMQNKRPLKNKDESAQG